METFEYIIFWSYESVNVNVDDIHKINALQLLVLISIIPSHYSTSPSANASLPQQVPGV